MVEVSALHAHARSWLLVPFRGMRCMALAACCLQKGVDAAG